VEGVAKIAGEAGNGGAEHEAWSTPQRETASRAG
jgi:hypothetical protein